MVKNSNWVAWVAILALVIAVIVLVVVLKSGMTGNAIFGRGLGWRNHIQDLSFETDYQVVNYENKPVVILKIPNELIQRYSLHATTRVTYKDLNANLGDSNSLINAQRQTEFNVLCRADSSPGFCEINLVREPLSSRPFTTHFAVYMFDRRGLVVAAGIYSTSYDGNSWSRYPYEKVGSDVFN